MKLNVINAPKGKYVYEFSVIIPQDDGSFLWHSDHAYVDEALAELDKTPNAILCHNVRVAHKELRENYEKLLTN